MTNLRYKSRIGRCISLLILGILFLHLLYFTFLTVLNCIRLKMAVSQVYPQLFDEHIRNYTDTDPRLLRHIMDYYLEPPKSKETPYSLSNANKDEYAQDKELAKLIRDFHGNKKGGFFVEAGAYNGEMLSNTLSYERDLDWTGLLVEPNPIAIEQIRAKNRKSWLLKGCIHPGNHAQKFSFYPGGWCGGLTGIGDFNLAKRSFLHMFYPIQSIEVWCFPLYSVLLAIQQSRVSSFLVDFSFFECTNHVPGAIA